MKMNGILIEFFVGKLGIKTDFKYLYALDIVPGKQDRMISICKEIEGKISYSGTIAKAFPKEEDLNSAGMELRYSVFNYPIIE